MLELIALTPVLTGLAIGAGAGAAGIALCRYVQARRMSRASADLQNVEDRWRHLVETTPNAVFVHAGGRIVFANRATVEMMGASGPEDLLGMTSLEFLHPDERVAIEGMRTRMAADRDSLDFRPTRFRTLDGRDLFVESGAAILSWDGDDAYMVVARDVTDRHLAEQALRDSEARYRAVVEDQEEMIGRALLDGTLTFVNDSFCRYFGRTRDELVGSRFLPMIPEDDRQTVQDALATLSPDNPTVTMEHHVVRPDGELRWHRWTDRLLLDGDGNPVELQAVGRDITEYRDAELALRDSEARYRAVVEDQTELIARYLLDGTLTFVNDAYCRFFGVNREEVLGRPFKARVPDEDHPQVDALIQRLAAGADTERRDRRVIRGDGEVLWIQWTNRAVRDAKGNLLEIQAVGREVTEQRRTAEALAASEARLRSIIDLAPVQIFVRDIEGRFLLVNQAVADMYGSTVEALTGAEQRDIHPDAEEMERFLRSDREVLSSGRRMVIPDQIFHDAQGRARHVETIKIPFATGAGAPAAIIGVSLDITEQRAAAEQLHQAQKMEAVGQLTGGVAHDFNNLLAVILGNLQLLEREVAENEEQRALAETAIDATRRGGALTSQLLTFSRQQPLEPGVLDLNRLIADSGELLTRSLGEPYDVRWDLAGDLGNVMADPTQMESAVLNLVINSGQAMPNGGPIVIRTWNAELTARDTAGLSDVAPGEYVALSVSDRGSGMSPDVAARAFDPFFTTKTSAGGSGLGLSMVYGFVRQSRGHVNIDSAEGEGTTVTLYLPRTNETVEADTGPRHHAANGAAPDAMVLLVEDDPDVRDIAVKLLGRLGYRVRVAVSGPDALREYEADSEIDILFTDMVLPDGMSGSDLALELRARRGDLPILFTSGNTEVNPAEDSRLSGRYAFLRKPYMAEELAFKLEELRLRAE